MGKTVPGGGGGVPGRVVQADWNVGEAWFRVGGRRVKSKVGAPEAL